MFLKKLSVVLSLILVCLFAIPSFAQDTGNIKDDQEKQKQKEEDEKQQKQKEEEYERKVEEGKGQIPIIMNQFRDVMAELVKELRNDGISASDIHFDEDFIPQKGCYYPGHPHDSSPTWRGSHYYSGKFTVSNRSFSFYLVPSNSVFFDTYEAKKGRGGSMGTFNKELEALKPEPPFMIASCYSYNSTGFVPGEHLMTTKRGDYKKDFKYFILKSSESNDMKIGSIPSKDFIVNNKAQIIKTIIEHINSKF